MESNLLVIPSWFRVYAGAMHTGKTNDLVNELLKISYSKRFPYQAFKPGIDKRYESKEIRSLNGVSVPALAIDEKHPELILQMLNPETRVVAIDEMQFWADALEEVIQELLARGMYVIGTLLDLNFRGEQFNPLSAKILILANDVKKTHGVCMADPMCSNPAVFTQRLLNGQPAPYDDPLVVVEQHDGAPLRTYRVVCRNHFRIPGKP